MKVVFDHNGEKGVSLNHTLIEKLHIFNEHYIHLLLYLICSFTSIKVTFINLKHYLVEIESLTGWNIMVSLHSTDL